MTKKEWKRLYQWKDKDRSKLWRSEAEASLCIPTVWNWTPSMHWAEIRHARNKALADTFIQELCISTFSWHGKSFGTWVRHNPQLQARGQAPCPEPNFKALISPLTFLNFFDLLRTISRLWNNSVHRAMNLHQTYIWEHCSGLLACNELSSLSKASKLLLKLVMMLN